MLANLLRAAPAVVLFLLGAALEVSGIEDRGLAELLVLAAFIYAIGAVVVALRKRIGNGLLVVGAKLTGSAASPPAPVATPRAETIDRLVEMLYYGTEAQRLEIEPLGQATDKGGRALRIIDAAGHASGQGSASGAAEVERAQLEPPAGDVVVGPEPATLKLTTFPPTVEVSDPDPLTAMRDKGDQLILEGSWYLDEIRSGRDLRELAGWWLDDVLEFLRTNAPEHWEAVASQRPTGLLPYVKSGNHPRWASEMASDIDRALFHLRRVVNRRYARVKASIQLEGELQTRHIPGKDSKRG